MQQIKKNIATFEPNKDGKSKLHPKFLAKVSG